MQQQSITASWLVTEQSNSLKIVENTRHKKSCPPSTLEVQQNARGAEVNGWPLTPPQHREDEHLNYSFLSISYSVPRLEGLEVSCLPGS